LRAYTLRFIGLLESLKSSVSSSEPLWLVGLAVLAVVLVVRMEADSSVVGRRSIELIVVLIGLTPGSA
jgi:hypothetical protein